MTTGLDAGMSTTRLNIGAGRTYLPGWINIDLAPWADMTLDLNQSPLPFPSDSVDTVFSDSTLEHIHAYLPLVGEIYRVLVPGGWLLASVPYATLTEYNLVNPYHQGPLFNEHSFDFFDPDLLKGSAVEPPGPQFRKVFHRLHYLPEFEDLSPEKQEWSRRHLLNVVQRMDVGLVALKPGSVETSEDLCQVMIDRFDACQREREPYPADVAVWPEECSTDERGELWQP